MRVLVIVFIFFSICISETKSMSNINLVDDNFEKVLWIIEISQGLTNVDVEIEEAIGSIEIFLKDSSDNIIYRFTSSETTLVHSINTVSYQAGTYTLVVTDEVNESTFEVIID